MSPDESLQAILGEHPGLFFDLDGSLDQGKIRCRKANRNGYYFGLLFLLLYGGHNAKVSKMDTFCNHAIEDEVSFTVPHLTPPSVNHYKQPSVYWKNGIKQKGMRLTPEAKAFKDAVCMFARGRTVAPAKLSERRKVQYHVEIDVYLGKNARLDADNGNKLCLDGLQLAGVIHSDAFVHPLIVRPHKDDRQNPRTEFLVKRTEPKQ